MFTDDEIWEKLKLRLSATIQVTRAAPPLAKVGAIWHAEDGYRQSDVDLFATTITDMFDGDTDTAQAYAERFEAVCSDRMFARAVSVAVRRKLVANP